MTERIRIWYLIGELRVGGTERTLIDLVSGLDLDRFEPTIWTISDSGPLGAEVPADIPVQSLDAKSKADLSAPFRFIRALRREQPDILQSFLYFDNVLARLAGLSVPKTTVISGVREVPDSMPRQRDIVDRITLPLSDVVVSNSRAGAEWVEKRGTDPGSVHVIHNGRDVDAYDVEAPSGFADSIGIPDGPIVGTVGRLVERKGHHDLIGAWPGIRGEYPDAQLVIVGDGPESDALSDHAERLNVGESVHLLGRRDDIPELLALFDVFAFPSHYEGLPGALLEAMCAGLPIVTTPVDGCAELVHHREHALHVPVRDAEALASAVDELLSTPAIASKLGENARKRAESEFSVGRMVDRFERLYQANR